MDLGNILKFAELTAVMRLRGNIDFIEFFNKIRVRNLDESIQNRLKANFVKENDINYPRNALYIFTENIPTFLHNKEILMSLSAVLFKAEAINAIPSDCKYPKV